MARQWAAAGSTPRARARSAVAPSRCLAKARRRARWRAAAGAVPPAGHEDGRGFHQDAAALREPSAGRGCHGRWCPAPEPQLPGGGRRATSGPAAPEAPGPARAAAEWTHPAEEAQRRRCSGEREPGQAGAPRTPRGARAHPGAAGQWLGNWGGGGGLERVPGARARKGGAARAGVAGCPPLASNASSTGTRKASCFGTREHLG